MEENVECEICGSTSNLVYDHNHNTGEFRGVLCNGCNRALGLFKDNPSIIKEALVYLQTRGDYRC